MKAVTQTLACLFCTFVATWQYLTLSLRTCTDCTQRIAAIASGTDEVPYVYRQLTPKLIVALGNTPEAFAIVHFTFLFLFFMLLWSWVKRWNGQPLAAVALTTVALSIMWPTYYYSVYTVTEWVLWLAALVLLTRFLLPLRPSTAK